MFTDIRLVIDGPPASVAPLFDAYGFAGGGEQVQQQVGLRPQPVGQVELLLGVVAPVEREPAHDVVVPGLDGGLVVLPVRAAAGLLDVLVLEPVDELVVDGLRAVVGVEAGDREREQGDRQVDGPADVGLGVVAHGDVHGPVGRVVHHRQRARELPLALGPQCATVSASAGPGRRAISSVHLRIRIELRRCSPAGRVRDMPWARRPV